MIPQSSRCNHAALCRTPAFVSPVVCILGREGVEAPLPADPHVSLVSSVHTELVGKLWRGNQLIYAEAWSSRLHSSLHILGAVELNWDHCHDFSSWTINESFGSNMGVMVHNNCQHDRI